MRTIPVIRAREELYRLLDEVSESSEPVRITGPRSDAILVSMVDWVAIQETLYLASITSMAASIRDGFSAPAEEFDEDPGWS